MNFRKWGVSLSTSAALIACIPLGAGWLSQADFTKAELTAPSTSSTVEGLTVLVSFADEAIPAGQALDLHEAMNGSSNSVKSYFRDMSHGAFTLNNLVLSVTLDENKGFYDTDESDQFNTNVGALDEVTTTGPTTRLLEAVVCKIRGCNGQPAAYEVVSSSSIDSPPPGFDPFAGLSRQNISFFPDNYVRQLTGNTDLQNRSRVKYADIPNIERFSYVNLFYAGKTQWDKPGRANDKWGHGLWPRSVPSLGTEFPGLPARLARFQIQGTLDSSSAPIGTLVHESGHTLFDLPDLYDAGQELGLPDSPAPTRSSGIGTHALMGATPGTTQIPTLSAPLRDHLGWANIIDITHLPEGTQVDLDTDGKDIARYCRPNSPQQECYYFEARSNGTRASGDTIKTPGEGLLIWHTQKGGDIVDYVRNNHEEMDRNLHYEISVVQADGLNELEAGGPADQGDYFRAGGQDAFNSFTSPSTEWWDDTDSGLAIHSISAPGPRMSFKIGRRPLSPLLLSHDPHVMVTGEHGALPVGSSRNLTFQGNPGYRYNLRLADGSKKDLNALSGTHTIDVPVRLGGTQLQVLSYPASASAPQTTDVKVRLQVENGAALTTYSSKARTYEGVSRYYDDAQTWTRYQASPNAERAEVGSNAAMTLPVTTDKAELPISAVAEPGHIITKVGVYGLTNSFARVLSGPASQINQNVILPAGGVSETDEYLVLVNAEPDAGYFCRPDFIPSWQPDRIYNDVGDLVRVGDVIYQSNVPRNYHRDGTSATPSTSKPQDKRSHWTAFVSCGAPTFDCSTLPEFSLGGAPVPSNPSTSSWSDPAHFTTGDLVQSGNRVFQLAGWDGRDLPGSSVGRALHDGAMLFARVKKSLPLNSNRNFVFPRENSWVLSGACADAASAGRATIARSPGVTSVSASKGTLVTPANEDAIFGTGLRGSWTLSFDVEPDFELVDVLANGVALGVSPNARSASIPAASLASTYVEIETRCQPGLCSRP